MRVVAYCRFSSEQQRDGYSIEAQKRAIEDYCAREEHTVIDYYIDEAKSGTNDDRDAFQNMIRDSASKKFQAVIVHKLDRFARDRYDSAIYKKKLKDNGVRLISVLEPLDGSPESVMMESVLEGMAEYYSRNLSREVLKGKQEAAKQAKHNGGMIPYGFTVDHEGHYIVNPVEGPIIKDIFDKLDAGYTLASVTRYLNLKGIKTRTGNNFLRDYISRIILNPMYKGQYVYGRTSKRGVNIVVDDAIEAIVTKEVWDRVNKEALNRASNRKTPAPKGDDYVLTGYVFCAICGSHLFGFQSTKRYKTSTGAKREYSAKFYRCAKKVSRPNVKGEKVGGCDFKNIKKDELETFVIKATESIIFSDDHLSDIVDKIKAHLTERLHKSSEAAGIENELKKIKSQQDRLLDLYLAGAIDIPTFNSRKSDLASSFEYYSSKLSTAVVIDPESINLESVKSSIMSFLTSADADSFEYKKLLLSTFVDSVIVDNTNIVIYFKFDLPGTFDGSTFSCVRGQQPRHTSPYARNILLIKAIYPIDAVFDLDMGSCSIFIM